MTAFSIAKTLNQIGGFTLQLPVGEQCFAVVIKFSFWFIGRKELSITALSQQLYLPGNTSGFRALFPTLFFLK
jgi:hypothetical protein